MISLTKKILIVDDEEDLRDTVSYKLKSAGFTTETACDGMDAMEKLDLFTPDLIILDMNMPRMNGLEFYQKIKGNSEKPPYPVIVLTARANMEQLFRDLDVDGFMSKPFDLDELLNEAKTITAKASNIVIESATKQSRARRICIVENKTELRNKLALSFLNAGYMVTCAHSGASAIKQIQNNLPDIAIISLALNDIAGDIVIGKLYNLKLEKEIQYLLYTDHIPDTDKTIIAEKISQKDGVCQFEQSTDPHDLLKKVNTLFEPKNPFRD